MHDHRTTRFGRIHILISRFDFQSKDNKKIGYVSKKKIELNDFTAMTRWLY